MRWFDSISTFKLIELTLLAGCCIFCLLMLFCCCVCSFKWQACADKNKQLKKTPNISFILQKAFFPWKNDFFLEILTHSQCTFTASIDQQNLLLLRKPYSWSWRPRLERLWQLNLKQEGTLSQGDPTWKSQIVQPAALYNQATWYLGTRLIRSKPSFKEKVRIAFT